MCIYLVWNIFFFDFLFLVIFYVCNDIRVIVDYVNKYVVRISDICKLEMFGFFVIGYWGFDCESIGIFFIYNFDEFIGFFLCMFNCVRYCLFIIIFCY